MSMVQSTATAIMFASIAGRAAKRRWLVEQQNNLCRPSSVTTSVIQRRCSSVLLMRATGNRRLAMSKTKDEVLEEINEFFSDDSRTPSETREGLQEIRDEIDTLIDCLDSDSKRG